MRQEEDELQPAAAPAGASADFMFSARGVDELATVACRLAVADALSQGATQAIFNTLIFVRLPRPLTPLVFGCVGAAAAADGRPEHVVLEDYLRRGCFRYFTAAPAYCPGAFG